MQLIFNSDTKDFTLKNFLEAVSDFENTLIIAKTNHGKTIGGFMTQKWQTNQDVNVQKG